MCPSAKYRLYQFFQQVFAVNISTITITLDSETNVCIDNCIKLKRFELSIYFQAQELRIYFKSLGAEISEEKSPKGIEDDLHKIIGVCEACFKEGNENEIETVLNDIVSIMIVVNIERLKLLN